MNFKVIGSGSSGNAYILDNGNERLILECGVQWSEIVKALGYSIDSVSGCLCTHIHKDHSLSIHKLLTFQIPVYSCKDVCERHKGVHLLEEGKKYQIGGFRVQPIAVKHNVENYAYLIEHPDMGRLVFITDASDFPYKIKDVNHWIIEANYSDEVIMERLMRNENIRSQSQNHLSIDKCVTVLRQNYTQSLQNVILIHLSDSNSNEKEFAQRIWDEIGIMPFVATSGLQVELNKEDF